MNALSGLMSPAAVAANTGAGFAAGVAQGETIQLRKLLAEHARNPADPGIVAEITTYNPELGARLEERQRTQQFNNAAVAHYQAGQPQGGAMGAMSPRSDMQQAPMGAMAGQPAQANALLSAALHPAPPPPQGSQMNALAPPMQPGASFNEAFAPYAGAQPQQAMPQQAQEVAPDFAPLGPPQTPDDAAFLRMLSLDAKKAFEIDSEMRDRAADRLKIQRDAYGFAVSRLGGVTDDAGYQSALADIASRIELLGVEITDHLPPRFPGPDAIKALRLGAVDAKDQIDLFMKEANIEADNERADRNTDSLIEDRDGRRAEQRRYNDERLETTRRGQDLTDSRVRSGAGRRGGSRRETLPVVSSPDEARRLPSGTRFKVKGTNLVKVVP